MNIAQYLFVFSMLNMINFDLCLPTLSAYFSDYFFLATGKLTLHYKSGKYYTCLEKKDYYSLFIVFSLLFWLKEN
jgi:hypothetical protein